jgi:hypothetical protein
MIDESAYRDGRGHAEPVGRLRQGASDRVTELDKRSGNPANYEIGESINIEKMEITDRPDVTVTNKKIGKISRSHRKENVVKSASASTTSARGVSLVSISTLFF